MRWSKRDAAGPQCKRDLAQHGRRCRGRRRFKVMEQAGAGPIPAGAHAARHLVSVCTEDFCQQDLVHVAAVHTTPLHIYIYICWTCARRRMITSTSESSQLPQSIVPMQKASGASQRRHGLHPPLYHPSGTVQANPSRDAPVYPKAKLFLLPLQRCGEALGRTGTYVGGDRG